MNPLDDEEERKKREAIAARMDEEAYGNPVGPVTPSFLDTAGQAIGNRFNAAMDRVSNAGDAIMNPQQALQQRMANEQQQEAADTEVKTQTVKTYGDGSQEQVVKTQIPAQQAQQQAPQQTQQAPMAAMMGPVAPNSPEAQQQAQQFAQAMAQAQQRPAIAENMVAKAEAQQPQQKPMGAMAPTNYSLATGQGQPGIRMPQMAPQAGQVAAAPGASLAQMGAGAQAQPRPAVQGTPYTPTAEREVEQPQPWVQAANDAGTDFYKLLDVANKHPESRQIIGEKIKQSFKQQTMKDEADEVMKAAQAGDLSAQNKILQSIKPEKGRQKEEVTVNDYLKAVLYKRLGLDAMAADVQNKIIGKNTKFGQVTIGNANWETETDSSGRIIRAVDKDGVVATESTLNQIRAGAQKFGSQAFGFTGESATIPVGQADAGQEYRQRTNSVSGAIENVITTGPNAGKIYSGPPGAAKSVGTSYSKALNDAYIKFQTAPTIEMAKTMLDIAGQVDSGDGKTIGMVNDKIRQLQPGIFNQISSGQSGNPPAPTGTGNNAKMLESLNRDLEANAREVSRMPANDPRRIILADERQKTEARIAELGGRVAPSVGGAATGTAGTSLGAQKAAIGTQAALTEAEGKPPAEARGKGKAQDITNQRSADENYGLIQPVADLIKKSTGSGIGARVDTLAGLFGVGTNGAQAIAQLNTMSYPFKYMIPRFEGPQSDRDTNLYVEAAGDFANPKKTQAERLSALQGMIFILKKYDKEGKNDWTFGGQDPTSTAKPPAGQTSSGNKFKKVE